MARAFGSYPKGHWFDSNRRYHIEAVKLLLFLCKFDLIYIILLIILFTSDIMTGEGENIKWKVEKNKGN